MVVKGVSKYDLLASLVLNLTLIRMMGFGLESLSLEIDDNISLPRMTRVDQKQHFMKDQVVSC